MSFVYETETSRIDPRKQTSLVPKWEEQAGGAGVRGWQGSNYRTWDGWQGPAMQHRVTAFMPCDKPKREKNTERVCMPYNCRIEDINTNIGNQHTAVKIKMHVTTMKERRGWSAPMRVLTSAHTRLHTQMQAGWSVQLRTAGQPVNGL